jgi:2-dehydro-3-deoxyphosphogluconate aldolase/(4S)-4-hydroxy-2-oxoglutarate aldolase
MHKDEVLNRIRAAGLVAVVRADGIDQAIRITEACLEGGAAAIEITFTVPGAHVAIRELRRRFGESQCLLGAGSVLDPETARIAILEGAHYVVAPCFNPDTVRLCNRYRIPCMPGAGTVAEVVACLEAGVDIVKVFPGELCGPAFIKGVKGPLPQAELMPTGGVSLENCAEWIRAGAVAVGVGSLLTSGAGEGDYARVTRTARDFVAAIQAARRLTAG